MKIPLNPQNIAETIKEIIINSTQTSNPYYKKIINNKVYWLYTEHELSTVEEPIWLMSPKPNKPTGISGFYFEEQRTKLLDNIDSFFLMPFETFDMKVIESLKGSLFTSIRDVDFFYNYEAYPSMDEVLIEADDSNKELIFSMPHFKALEATFDPDLMKDTISLPKKIIARFQTLALSEDGDIFEENNHKGFIDKAKKSKQGKFLFLKLLMESQSREGKSNIVVSELELKDKVGNKDFKSLYSKLNTENLRGTSYTIRAHGKGYLIEKRPTLE